MGWRPHSGQFVITRDLALSVRPVPGFQGPTMISFTSFGDMEIWNLGTCDSASVPPLYGHMVMGNDFLSACYLPATYLKGT